jgi:poly-gamma-glutamate capsule biosynthesis protein CapA/YwtB (metallophosphatase superfamily)
MRFLKIIFISGYLLILSFSAYCADSPGQSEKNPDDGFLTIGLTGDIMLGRRVNEVIKKEGYLYPWGNMIELLRSTDLNLVNLETTLTSSTSRVTKSYNFKAAPDKVQSLIAADVDVCSIANNHILDFGIEGLFETITTLENAGLLYTGAGSNIYKAREPVVVTENGIIVGIIGCTDNEPGWNAGKTRPGTFYVNVNKPEALVTEIKSLRPLVDILILTMHWGPNMRQKPTRAFVKFAHSMIDAGIDIFHGHSAHVFQGIEVYKEKLILYDTGDFVDDYRVNLPLRTDQSFFYIVKTDRKGIVELELVPVLISNMQVNLAAGAEYKEIVSRIKQLSEEFSTDIYEINGRLVIPVRKPASVDFINRI